MILHQCRRATIWTPLFAIVDRLTYAFEGKSAGSVPSVYRVHFYKEPVHAVGYGFAFALVGLGLKNRPIRPHSRPIGVKWRAKFRTERDSMGEVKVPKGAYYGAQTQRAVENFPISGIGFPPQFIRALGMIKSAAASTNEQLGLLEPRIAAAIRQAAQEVIDGKLDREFVVDIFQTGSGTSTNMNANEVIANRALEILERPKGSGEIHPNDHVNMCQSSNDVIPTALHCAARVAVERELLPALTALSAALGRKAKEFDDVMKIGRTHLADATPMRLGQEFSGYARQIELSMERIKTAGAGLAELPLAEPRSAPASTAIRIC